MNEGSRGKHVNHRREVRPVKQTTVHLPETTYSRLQDLAARTGCTAMLHIREAIEQHIEDFEDLHTAEKAASEHRKTNQRTISLDELDRYLGVES